MSTLPPSDFFGLCRTVGSDPCLIQGPGGNVSVKAPRSFFIKASGSYLKALGPDVGWVAVDLGEFRSRFIDLARAWATDSGQSADRFEKEYSALVKQVSLSTQFRASMELGFHALLPQPWVVHVHSLAAQLLAQDPARRAELASSIYGLPSRFVPYTMPGFRLSWRIYEIAETLAGAPNALFFLENHGLIVAAESAERALEILGYFEEPRKTWDEISQNVFFDSTRLAFQNSKIDISGLVNGCPFPDFAILAPAQKLASPEKGMLTFNAEGLSAEQRQDTAETITAALVLLQCAQTKGVPFPLLDSMTQESLRDLPTEIERMKSRARSQP